MDAYITGCVWIMALGCQYWEENNLNISSTEEAGMLHHCRQEYKLLCCFVYVCSRIFGKVGLVWFIDIQVIFSLVNRLENNSCEYLF